MLQVPALGVSSQPLPKKKAEVDELFDEGVGEEDEDLFSNGTPTPSTSKVTIVVVM